jgi:hypothetical protein
MMAAHGYPITDLRGRQIRVERTHWRSVLAPPAPPGPRAEVQRAEMLVGLQSFAC